MDLLSPKAGSTAGEAPVSPAPALLGLTVSRAEVAGDAQLAAAERWSAGAPATHGRARRSRYVHAQSGARCAAVTGTEPLALASRARRSGTDADALADGK